MAHLPAPQADPQTQACKRAIFANLLMAVLRITPDFQVSLIAVVIKRDYLPYIRNENYLNLQIIK